MKKPDGRGAPEMRQRYRHRAYRTMEYHAYLHKTFRGLGTGAGRKKGTKNKINNRVREVIASVAKAFDEGQPYEAVARHLALIGLTEPEVFAQMKRKAPRFPTAQHIEPKKVELVRTLTAPTDQEISDFTKLPLQTILMAKQSGTGWYEHLRQRTIEAKLTPEERNLIELAKDQFVANSLIEASMKPKRRRLKRD